MIITKIEVVGESTATSDGTDPEYQREWGVAKVDDGEPRHLRVIIQKTQGHPLKVFIQEAYPLYMTVVYDEKGTLLGVSGGQIGGLALMVKEPDGE